MSQKEIIRPTPFDVPLLLFLLSAASGVWMAGGQPDAWFKFWMIVGGLALYGVLALVPDRVRIEGLVAFNPLRLLLGALPLVVTAYFLLTNDWTNWMGKLPGSTQIAHWFLSWRPSWGDRVNPNMAGGIIAVALPLQVVALRRNGHGRHLTLGAALAIGVAVLCLVMTLSRNAWLALAVVMGGWGLWRLRARWVGESSARQNLRAVLSISTLAIVGLGGILLLMFTPLGSQLQTLVEIDRLQVWRTGLDLLSDYPLTGLGLGNFQMAHASYVMLLHVGHTFHAHNLFLDLWLEQGLLGILAFGWLVVKAIRLDRAGSQWQPAALASLGVILLHGLGDDPLYGSGGLAVLMLFVPFALLARPQGVTVPTGTAHPVLKPQVVFPASLVVIAAVASLIVPGLQSATLANLGAAIQTHIELPVYRWPEWPIQDALRRSPDIDLGPAIAYYQAALRLDPHNATANRRLGQIELSLGQYEAGCRHVEEAYKTAPGQRATRQLFGECYAISGDIRRAADLWRTVDVSQGQLTLRQWWYDHLGEKQHAEWIRQAAESLAQ